MSFALEASAWIELARPHVLPVALLLARFVPSAFLTPMLGGQVAPAPARLALCLAFALHAHLGGDVWADPALGADLMSAVAAAARELFAGTAIAVIASLPFDAARMGGRFLDTFRGANAEASLPATGSREAATGDFLHQLLTALVFAGPLYRVLATSLITSVQAAPLGLSAPFDTQPLLELVLLRAGAALATGLAIGAPAAAVSMLVDLALGVLARVAPSMALKELGAPAKLLAGGAAILFALGTISGRLLTEISQAAATVDRASQALGGAL